MKHFFFLLLMVSSISAFADASRAEFDALNFKEICSSDFKSRISNKFNSQIECDKDGLAITLLSRYVTAGRYQPRTAPNGVDPKGYMSGLLDYGTFFLTDTITLEVVGYKTVFYYDYAEVFVLTDLNGEIAVIDFFGFR